MPQDDFHVIACKILAYLYSQMKQGKPIDTNQLSYGSDLFDIPQGYLFAVLDNLQKKGYIEGMACVRNSAGAIVKVNYSAPAITMDGIEYLQTNPFMSRSLQVLLDTGYFVSLAKQILAAG